MKSLNEWRQENFVEFDAAGGSGGADTNWGYMKYIWGQQRQLADPNLLMKLRNRIEPLKNDFATQLGFSKFSDVPVAKMNDFAKDLVTGLLKVVYGDEAGQGNSVTANALSKINSQPSESPLPQDQTAAPSGWKG